MGLGHSPSIIVDGLIFHIDPNNPRCSSGSGNTIYNLVNPSIGGTFVGFTANPIDNTETRSLAYNGSTTYQEFYPIEPTRLTVSVWFKATGVPSLNDIYGGIIIGSSPQYYISYGMGYNWISNTILIFQTSPGEIISASAPANKIVNAVYAYDGVNAKLYIDGVLASTVAYTTDPSYPGSGNRNLQLGRWGYPGYERYFNGNIYQASIYNRALSASEILQNYNAKRKKFYPEENIVSDGLVLHIDPSKNTSYPGTGNTIYDLSGSGNTGTLSAGLTFSALNGGSIVNDAGNKVLSYQSANFSTNNFTMEAWVSVKSYPGTNAVFISNRGTNDNGWLLDVTFNKKGRIFIQRDAGTFYSLETINDLGLNKWTNLSVVRSGTNLSLYRDGVLQNSTTLPANYDIQSAYANDYVTRYFGSNGALDGNISTIKYYNRALSATEIQQNYNATKGRFLNALPPVRNGLVLELDALSYSGFGNTWNDLSGNNNTSVLTNGPAYTFSNSLSNFSFDGSNDYVVVNSNADLLSKTEYTKFIFFYATSFSTANNLISGGVSGTNHAFWLNFSNRLYAGHNASWSTVTGSTTLSTNTWYCGAVTYSNVSGWKLYLNGVLDGTSATSTTFDNSGELLIAAYANANVFTGRISLAMVYNRALSAYEIKQNFDYYRTRYNI